MEVARDIIGIVEVDEIEPRDGQIQRRRRNKKGQRDPQVDPGMTRWP